MKTVLASLLLLLAVTSMLVGLVGLLSNDPSTASLLISGWLFIGGGLGLAQIAWRLYRRLPSLRAQAEGRTPEQIRELSQATARRQWLTAAKFLVVMTVIYLLLALFLVGHGNAVQAASTSAVTAGAFGLLAYWQGRRNA